MSAYFLPSMNKSERAKYIAKELERLFPETPIPLHHTDTFTLLVAVVLSAQTTDKKVNEVTPALFAAAPGPTQMAQLGEAKILGFIKQLGLAPQKSKALVGLSQKILLDFGGEVPKTFEELISLPGVGRKTAQVVMAQAYGMAAFPVDTHIHRLAKAWKLSSGKNVLQTEMDLKKAFPEKLWNKLHLQIIFFGRQVCQARQCNGKQCYLCQKLRS